jgi:predicted lipoprotein
MKFFLLPILFLVTTSCSDFFGGGTVNDPAKNCLNCLPEMNPFPKGFDPSSGDFSPEKMLASIGTQGIYPMVYQFSTSAIRLNQEVQNFCQIGSPSESQFQMVQYAWKKAMMAFHQVKAAPIGPLEENDRRLANEIYAWPLFNSCGIDLEVARLSQGGALNPELFYTMKGLAGLEYLLFERTYGTSCKSSPKNQPAFDWTQKSTDTKQKDRCQLARFVAQDVEAQARSLEFSWNPAAANYSNTLINGTKYKNGIKEAVNAMSDALFALENVKDMMLGIPLGLHKNCVNINEKCPESAEHQHSGLSIEAAVNHLKGFRKVFTAGEGRGFNEYLADKGFAEVNTHLLGLVDQAIQSGEALTEPGLFLKEIEKMSPGQCKITSSTNRIVPVCAFYRDVQELSKKLKIEFLTALSLDAPSGAEGDND